MSTSLVNFGARKLGAALVTLLLALTAAFALGHLSGDPVYNILGPLAEREQIDAMRTDLGLDKPITEQYVVYLGDTVRGELGDSLQYFRSNAELISSRLPQSIQLLAAAMFLAILIGVPLGTLAAVKEGTWWDRAASTVALLGQSVPVFWLGLMLILIFAVQLRLLPSGQSGGLDHLILPAITLSLLPLAHIARLTRASMAEALAEPYIDAARARGLSSRRIVGLHALRNAALPVLTVTALQTGVLLSGAVAVEYVYSWPGLGTLALEAVQFRDYTLAQAVVIVGAVAFVALNLLVDLLYVVVDPRLR
jgi:peptide/nickel transport system permease protein